METGDDHMDALTEDDAGEVLQPDSGANAENASDARKRKKSEDARCEVRPFLTHTLVNRGVQHDAIAEHRQT